MAALARSARRARALTRPPAARALCRPPPAPLSPRAAATWALPSLPLLRAFVCLPLSRAQSVRVKLIDFGGATFAHEHHSDVVCTRQYRPPEVTLGVAWGTAVDLWSAACILAELYTGRVLFATHDEAEHLAMMERSLGTLPQRMARRASERAKRWWLKHNSLLWPEIAPSPRSVRRVRETPRLRDFLQRDRPWVRLHDSFLHLLSQLLEWDPRARISALEALQHPFMQAEELRRGVFL